MKNSLLIGFKDIMKYEKLGVQIDPNYTNQIKNDIKIRFGTYEKAAKKAGFSHRVINEMQKRCIRVYNWNKLIILLELQIDDFEKHIIKIADKRIYNITFPYEVSPLLIRLVSHIIGDGGYYGNNARWIQKDVQPIINIQNSLLNISVEKTKSKNAVEQVSIMNFYIKLACSVLKINRNQIRSPDFIRAVIELPRHHKIQTFAAILEDEGKIQAKSGSIQIAMKDFEIIKSLTELMDDLEYDRSPILKIKNKEFNSNKDSYLFSVYLRVLGAHKFLDDLRISVEKYGKLAGLWKKQKQLEELVFLNDGRKAEGEKINRELSNKTVSLMKLNNSMITYKVLKNLLQTSHHRTGSVIRRLHNKGIIDKERRGTYVLIMNN